MTKNILMRRNHSGGLAPFSRDMDAFMQRFFGDQERDTMPRVSVMPTLRESSTGIVPKVESYIDNNTLIVQADLPGMDPKDMEVSLEGNCLSIKGQRKMDHEHNAEHSFHHEVSHGSFLRTFTLPERVNTDELKANYTNGVLEVLVPLPETMVPKKIPIALASDTSEHAISASPNGSPEG